MIRTATRWGKSVHHANCASISRSMHQTRFGVRHWLSPIRTAVHFAADKVSLCTTNQQRVITIACAMQNMSVIPRPQCVCVCVWEGGHRTPNSATAEYFLIYCFVSLEQRHTVGWRWCFPAPSGAYVVSRLCAVLCGRLPFAVASFIAQVPRNEYHFHFLTPAQPLPQGIACLVW